MQLLFFGDNSGVESFFHCLEHGNSEIVYLFTIFSFGYAHIMGTQTVTI